MAIPIPTIIDAVDASAQLFGTARRIRQLANYWIAKCDTGTVDLHELTYQLLRDLRDFKARWEELAVIPGVGAAVEGRLPGETFDADAEIAATTVAITGIQTFISGQMPVESSGIVKVLKIVDNEPVQQTTSHAPSIAALRTQFETLRDLVTEV